MAEIFELSFGKGCGQLVRTVFDRSNMTIIDLLALVKLAREERADVNVLRSFVKNWVFDDF